MSCSLLGAKYDHHILARVTDLLAYKRCTSGNVTHAQVCIGLSKFVFFLWLCCRILCISTLGFLLACKNIKIETASQIAASQSASQPTSQSAFLDRGYVIFRVVLFASQIDELRFSCGIRVSYADMMHTV